jgi:surface antigen
MATDPGPGDTPYQHTLRNAVHEYMAAAYKVPGANVHWYGKDDVKKGRKVRVDRWAFLSLLA